MTKISSLYDAIIKYKKPEDQCTNFLMRLLDILPSEVLSKICEESKLSCFNDVHDNLIIDVQYTLDKSVPDAIIEFSKNKYIIIEVKLYPNSFNEKQFIYHFNGGREEFGKENTWFLFLSGDKNIPPKLNELIMEHQGRIGQISWNSIIILIKEIRESLDRKYEIILNEFLIFAQHYKLGRLISMNNEEMEQFIEKFSQLEKFRKPCTDKLLKTINIYGDNIIINSNARAEATNDEQVNLPSLYKCFKIKGWHTKYSAYLFINISKKLTGICFTGYQDDENEMKNFLKLWGEKFNDIYKEDARLKSFTWIDKDEDDLAINGGYFKEFEETRGKSFNPAEIVKFSNYFYFGYTYELDISKLEDLTETITNDFNILLDKLI